MESLKNREHLPHLPEEARIFLCNTLDELQTDLDHTVAKKDGQDPIE